MGNADRSHEAWPELAPEAWADTYATLHRWMQIVGKIRLATSPWLNHGWHATLYPTSSGLTTSLMAYRGRAFQIDFDFLEHELLVRTSEGGREVLKLEPQSVATFHERLMQAMGRLGMDVKIHGRPNEVADAIPFVQDTVHASYDPEHANRFWRVLLSVSRVMHEFRVRFAGKCSPVHLFWGAPDLAVTRFSGRPAPRHPGGVPNLPDWVTRDAYSHEVISCGFWPGGGPVPFALFYSYAYPEPAGFSEATVKPGAASYHAGLKEFILPYDAVRQSDSPDRTLLEFLQTTYEAAADLAGWDRHSLERAGHPKDAA